MSYYGNIANRIEVSVRTTDAGQDSGLERRSGTSNQNIVRAHYIGAWLTVTN